MDENRDHVNFSENHTAAAYVANALDDSAQEFFEEHMMGCRDCVEEVEVWRAIKHEMPSRQRPGARAPKPRHTLTPLTWQLAASIVGVSVIGAAGGWFAKDLTVANLNTTDTVVFNLPSISRSAGDCTALRIAGNTRLAIIRVSGISRDLRLVALDGDRLELPAARYSSRQQPDGSRLLQIDPQLLIGRTVHLEAHHPDGTSDPLGCLVADLP
jgi:hypothetical protein